MQPLVKRIIKGALIAACGAFLWALLGCELSEIGRGESRLLFHFWIAPIVAGYAVLLSSWFILPIGGLLGGVMPTIIRSCSRRQAFVRGLLLGICVGLIAAALTTIFTYWPDISGSATIINRQEYLKTVCDQFVGYLSTMTPVCAIWVGIWAWRWSKNSEVILV